MEDTGVELTFRSIDYASDAERITTVRRRVRFAAVPFGTLAILFGVFMMLAPGVGALAMVLWIGAVSPSTSKATC